MSAIASGKKAQAAEHCNPREISEDLSQFHLNYLAHLFLAGPSDASRVGNLLGDFVKGTPESLQDQFPPEVIAGIMMHRRLDRFTDDHEAFLKARQLLAPERRRFAGIVIDIFFDHFLTVHWDKFADHPLPEFLEEIYSTLLRRPEWLSPQLARIVPRMKDENWLHSYGTIEGLSLTFHRIARRSPRITPIRESPDDLVAHYHSFDRAFHDFFPATRHYASLLRSNDR